MSVEIAQVHMEVVKRILLVAVQKVTCIHLQSQPSILPVDKQVQDSPDTLALY